MLMVYSILNIDPKSAKVVLFDRLIISYHLIINLHLTVNYHLTINHLTINQSSHQVFRWSLLFSHPQILLPFNPLSFSFDLIIELIGWYGWLIDWLVDWLIDWLVDWLVGWLIGWLIDWLVDWLICWFGLLIYLSFNSLIPFIISHIIINKNKQNRGKRRSWGNDRSYNRSWMVPFYLWINIGHPSKFDFLILEMMVEMVNEIKNSLKFGGL